MCICCCMVTPRKSSLSTTSLSLRIHFYSSPSSSTCLFVRIYEAKDISSYNRITPLLQFFFLLYFPLFTRMAHSYYGRKFSHTNIRSQETHSKSIHVFPQQQQHLVLLHAALRYVFFVFNIIILLYTENFM